MSNTAIPGAGAGPASWLEGLGESGEMLAKVDWSRTPLGPLESWPRSLVNYTRMILEMPSPAILFWGPEQTQIYNAGYAAIMGPRHPRYFGAPYRECWPDTYPIVYPWMQRLFERGETTKVEKTLIPVTRHGFPEETYFTFTFSPIRGDDGRIEGIFQPVVEVTESVLAERRAQIIHSLVPRPLSGDPAAAAMETLAGDPNDIPFSFLFLQADSGDALEVAALTGGLPDGPAAVPEALRTAALEAFESNRPILLERAGGWFGPRARTGPWPEPVEGVFIHPIRHSETERPLGAILFGLSPRLKFDANYRTFLETVVGRMTTAIDTAKSFHEARRRAESLAELDRAKTAFFGNVSHELRTPLTLMLGPLEDGLADPEHPLPEAQRERQALVLRNARRLHKLVNSLLDFSRLEAGRFQASFVPVDLASRTAELAGVFRSAMEKAGLRYQVDCPPLAGSFFVDLEMWEKVVLNLLSNAFKHTLAGGIRISLRPADGGAALEVRDTGVGIPAEELPRLFERFHRIPGLRARSHEGTGIGLALVQEIARLHGGRVEVESELGVGTAFTLHLRSGSSHLPADQVRLSGSAAPRSGFPAWEEEALAGLPSEERGDSSGAPGGIPVPRNAGDPGRPRILIVDDNRDMRAYMLRILGERWSAEAAANGSEALDSIRRNPPDLVVSDVMMPDMDGFQLLAAVRSEPGTAALPFILLSARAGEEATVEGLEAGADDYIVKPFSGRELVARVAGRMEISRLNRQKELLQARHAEELGRSEAFHQSLIANSPDCIKVLDGQARLLSMNAGGMKLLGIDDLTAHLGRSYLDLWPEPYRRTAAEALAAARAGGMGRFQGELPVSSAGRTRWWDVIITAIPPVGGDSGLFLAVSRDVTPLREAERDIHNFKSLIEESSDFIGIGHLDGAPRYINAAGLRMVGLPQDADLGGLRADEFYFPEDAEARARIGETFAGTGRWEGELRLRHFGTGRSIPVFMNVFLLKDMASGRPVAIATVVRDLTQLKETEEHLRQSQKMEAIGKLAGGIAHDFNNLLTAINGYAELSLGRPEVTGALREYLAEIQKSGARAALLTTQLLAFSRKQVLSPRVINLNAVLGEMHNMLRRLIGEDIELATRLDPALGNVKADPGQVQQVILNLVLNARDAMPEGGRLVLETANVILDASCIGTHLETDPGPCAMLSVSDNGLGMTAEIKSRIFEPFFTTKQVGKGTGLGLSSVYGIIQQSGGGIAVDSEPGRGAVFRIYLPLVETAVPSAEAAGDPVLPAEGGKGTILLVEDEAPVLRFIRMSLENQGYQVLVAGDGKAALELCDSHSGTIHLLLTDVVMPRMGGRKLAELVRERRPGIRVLFMSGYPDHADQDFARDGKSEGGAGLLQKPFSQAQLAGKLREILAAEPNRPGLRVAIP